MGGAAHAEPATGEATASGPATLKVTDGGAGIRFNFPGIARFRPISWSEWFDNFDFHGLTFVFEEEVADRAYEYWQARGGGDGHDQDDWFQAEAELGLRSAGAARYRLVKERSAPARITRLAAPPRDRPTPHAAPDAVQRARRGEHE